MKRVALMVIALVLCVCSVAFAADPVAVEQITVDKQEVTLPIGKNVSIKATISPKNATNKKVEWGTSDEGVATVKNGKISCVSAGEAVITVSAADGSGAKAEVKVTVVNPVKKIVPKDAKIALAPDTTWKVEVSYEPADATIQGVEWKSSNEKVASVDENGLVTGQKKGNCKLTGLSKDGSGVKVQVAVTVKDYDVVIREPGVVDVDFDTTPDDVSSSVSMPGYHRTVFYKRSITFGNDVVAAAGGKKLRPLKGGEGTVEILENNNGRKKKTKKTVYVAQAVGDEIEKEKKSNLSLGKTIGATSVASGYGVDKANDGDVGTYWESKGYPADVTIDLEDKYLISSVTIKLNPGWESRTQNIEIYVTPEDGETFTKVADEEKYKYDPASQNIVTIEFAPTEARYVGVHFISGTWKNSQIAEIVVKGPEE